MKDALVVTTRMIVMLPLKRICKYYINNYIGRGFQLRQLWIANYYVKCLSNNHSNENIICIHRAQTGVLSLKDLSVQCGPKKIEPSFFKVTVIRETRAVNVAK